jgi:anti-repressor protein
MYNLEVFKNEDFGSVRALVINDEPWFVGKDVAEVLGYKNPNDALGKHVENEDKDTIAIRDSIGRNRNTPIINESGLYSLVLSSKLESAKKFKRWVTSEVLPTLRKTGKYSINEMDGKELLARAVIEANKLIEEKDRQIEEMKPKALFTDAVSASKGSITIGALAKMLTRNGVTIGQNRLYAWLRENGYVVKDGRNKNVATQRYVEQGLFELKENLTFENGEPVIRKPTTMVTGKGQKYFINMFLRGLKF